MDDLQTLISRCRKAAEDATPGPWTNRMQDGVCNKYIDEGIVISFEERNNMRHEDIKFIVLSRATYLAALSVVETAAILVDWDTGDALCERDSADRRLRAALAAFADAARKANT